MINRLLHWLIILLPFALPLYVVRFAIGPLPTTLLEVYILILIATWLLNKVICHSDRSGGIPYHKLRDLSTNARDDKKNRSSEFGVRSSLEKWFWPLIAWLAATLVAVIVAGDVWAALGHWRAFVLEPVLVFVVLLDVLLPAGSSKLQMANSKSFLKKSDDVGPSSAEALAGRRATCDVRRATIIYSIALVTILLGAYAIVQYVTGWGIPSPWDTEIGRRATGIFGYPNGLSLFIVPFGIISWIAFLQNRSSEFRVRPAARSFSEGWSSILYLCAALSAGVVTVLAKSMGGILAFGIGVTLSLILLKKTRIVGIALAVIGILGAGFVAWQIYGTEMHPQTIEDSLASTKKWSSSVRVIIWKESFEIIKDHPVLGTGLRSYKTAILPYHEATWMETFPHPHNIFLMLWIETGLAGLLAFLWLIATWFFIVLRPVGNNKLQIANCKSFLKKSETNDSLGVRSSEFGVRLLWLIPLIVILVHGMVDMPYFKNDLAVQFFLLAAIATFNVKLQMTNSKS